MSIVENVFGHARVLQTDQLRTCKPATKLGKGKNSRLPQHAFFFPTRKLQHGRKPPEIGFT